MDFEVKVQNLGKISDSTIFVKPLTIITGSNASGKSFFTKTLYSIINILNQNLFKPTVLKDLRMLDSLLDFLESEIPYKGKRDTNEINDLRIISNSLQDNIFELSDFELEGFFSSSKELSKKIKDFQNKISIIEKRLNESTRKSSETVSKILDTLKFRAERINEMILGSENAYTDFIKESIDKDLNLNFQISNSSELISFDKSFAKRIAPKFVMAYFALSSLLTILSAISASKIAFLFSGNGMFNSSKYLVYSRYPSTSLASMLSTAICFSKGTLSNILQSSLSFSANSLSFFL